MRTTHLLLAATLLAAGCASNTEPLAEAQKAEIGFETFVNKSKTRVDINMDNVNQFHMAIWGVARNTTNGYQDQLWSGTEFECNNGIWMCSDEETKFWKAGSTYDFLAIMPFSIAKEAYIKDNITIIPGVPMVSLVNDGADLLVAGVTDRTKENNGITPVQLNFKHMLTRLSVYVYGVKDEAAQTQPEITIKNLTLFLAGSSREKATFTQGEYGEEFTGTWTWPTSAKMNPYAQIVPSSNLPMLAENSDDTQLKDGAVKLENEYFLAPSPEGIVPFPEVEVTYTVDGTDYTKTAAVTGITNFKQGYQINLFIGLHGNEAEDYITFTNVEVQDWDIQNAYDNSDYGKQ